MKRSGPKTYYWDRASATRGELPGAIDSLIGRFNKKLMVVETAYPFTMQDADSAANILKQDALIDLYPATPRGQLRYMKDLTKSILDGGGAGVVYWEPAWISSSCSTRWGQGSHWDNATFFDFQGNTLPVFKFFRPYDQR